MERTIHFIAGMPRSGSTLLCNLLAQNPRFHTTSTSGIVGVVRLVNEQWSGIIGGPDLVVEAARRRALAAILQCFHDDPLVPKPVVFDKSRGWLGNLNLAEMALGRKVKVLVCVRDIRDVLASFERLWRKNAATWAQSQEQQHYIEYQTVEGRCDVLMKPDQVVGGAYQRIKKSLMRGMRDRMHFVEFEQMTRQPQQTTRRIYQFLEEPYYAHDFDNVEQVTTEDDFMHGIPGLHTIRQKIEPMSPQWPKTIGDVAAKYEPYNNLWRGLINDLETPAAAQGGTGLI
jgi:sulfotransferase